MRKHLLLLALGLVCLSSHARTDIRDAITFAPSAMESSLPAAPPRTASMPQQSPAPDQISYTPLNADTRSEQLSFVGYTNHDKMNYAIYGNSEYKVATLIGWIDSKDYYPRIVVPDTVDYEGESVPVTTINSNAFSGGWGITGLTLGKNVLSISDYAFYYCAIEELTIPKTVSNILRYAFFGCPLRKLIFEDPSSVETPLVLGAGVFGENLLTSFEVPARLRFQSELSFSTSFCSPLWDSPVMQSITINPAFSKISREFELKIIDGALCREFAPTDDKPYKRLNIIAYPSARHLDEFRIEGEYIDVFDGAFIGAEIDRVILSSSLARREGKVNLVIGKYAFAESTLSKLSLSADGPISLSAYFASLCPNLEAYTLDDRIANYKVFDGVIYAKKDGEKYLVSYPYGRKPAAFTVPDDVMHLAQTCFFANPHIEEITLPAGLKSIEWGAFQNCANLKRLIFNGTSLQSIASRAFTDTQVISSAPQGEVALGNWLIGYNGETPADLVISDKINHSVPNIFASNDNIRSVTFPKDFEEISEGMLYGCHNLKQIVFPENLKTIGNSAFFEAGISAEITRAEAITDASLILPEGLKTVGYAAFRGSKLSENLVVPGSVEVVENFAFAALNDWKEVTLLRATPPAFIDQGYNIFNSGSLNNASLIVPKDADLSGFTEESGWGFRNITRGDFMEVEDTMAPESALITGRGSISTADGSLFDLYTTDGLHIGRANAFSGLEAGIYIVRLGAASRLIRL